MSRKLRKNYSPEEKLSILKALFGEGAVLRLGLKRSIPIKFPGEEEAHAS